jgi:hypothetical protein
LLINPGDVADGVLVSAIGATVRMMAQPLSSRRVRDEMNTAAWLSTGALTVNGLPGATLELVGLSEDEGEELRAALQSVEVQGALQALLAARLTDAPETEAGKAREAVRAAVAGPGTRGSRPGTPSAAHGAPTGSVTARCAEQVSGYYDDKICTLVGDLQGRAGAARLSQVRSEAYSSRIVALLGTLTDLVAALASPDRGGEAEADFLARYRRQARIRHGYLVPPDFDRRRRVRVDDIYVACAIDKYPRLTFPVEESPPSLNVWGLAESLDRTVLLGDPGGGKTTAANVLANFFASDADGKVPFLVTLRDYASLYPPERSVAGHIGHALETLYECAAPDGLIERLLLTGRAVVIFDGLDELLDTSRRRDVSERVEQFCSAYPLTPVLVTSRLVGYDQARLDDEQFTCYRLDGFGDNEVAEYARKWFAAQEEATPATVEAEATSFLAESASASDLRSNPLLLSLMCILYRGTGSLPSDRAGVYTKCAELLFGKWDEQRHIHRELRAGDFVEPALRHLAWWLFSCDNSRAAVTERALVDEVAGFLNGRAFESGVEARAAAREFVEFCRGRMWVLSDAGTTADGEKLYAFTHRTFLEYFAAAQLAAVSDTPEELAHMLAPHVAAAEWEVVSRLAIQLKDRAADRGADRIYATLLDPTLPLDQRGALVAFLAESVPSVRLSPTIVRRLTRATLESHPDGRGPDERNDVRFHALSLLLADGMNHEQVIADEFSNRIGAMVVSDAATRANGLQLALEAAWVGVDHSDFWRTWAREQAERYAAEIATEAATSTSLRTVALHAGVISIGQALEMPGGLGALMQEVGALLSRLPTTVPYPLMLCSRVLAKIADADAVREFAAIGRYLLSHPVTPWIRTVQHVFPLPVLDSDGVSAVPGLLLDEQETLGFMAVVCVIMELSGHVVRAILPDSWYPLGSQTLTFDRYITCWERRAATVPLPDLSVPTELRQVFKDWATGRVNFVELIRE